MTTLCVHRGLGLRYALDAARLGPALASCVVPLSLDASTRAWLDDAIDHPTSAVRLAARAAAKTLLGDYDANALFDTHDMRVLGTEQWHLLLGDRRPGRWLDVGAGDGRVTRALAPLAREVVTTELSPRMAARLRERGFVCHELDLATTPLPDPEPFDVVSALNVIDRTAKPYTLVEKLRDRLAPGGLLVLAVPLPLAPHVHRGAATVDPDELLPIDRRSFEEAARTLVELGLRPLGLAPAFVSRVPYLSRGDKQVPVHVLDDLVVGLVAR